MLSESRGKLSMLHHCFVVLAQSVEIIHLIVNSLTKMKLRQLHKYSSGHVDPLNEFNSVG